MKQRLVVLCGVMVVTVAGMLWGILLDPKMEAWAAGPLERSVIHVSQDAPVVIEGKTITISVGLDVQIRGVSGTVRALPSTPVVVVGSGDRLVDALGNEYVIGGDPDVAVEEWTVYEDDGDLSIVGSVRNDATGKRFSGAVVDFRFYDAKGKLVDARNEGIGGAWIDPGESYPFTMKRVSEMGAFVRYEVKIQVRDWTEVK